MEQAFKQDLLVWQEVERAGVSVSSLDQCEYYNLEVGFYKQGGRYETGLLAIQM